MLDAREDDPLDFVFSNFTALEKALIECIDYVPFIKQNEGVVSPKFVPLILESCGLIESVFRYNTPGSERHNLKSYSEIFEDRLRLGEASTLFLAQRLHLLRPFFGWGNAPTAWWDAYNGLKHDRINNYFVATFGHAVNALAALHQVLVRSRSFVDQLLKSGWINESDSGWEQLMTCQVVGCALPMMPAESLLFVSPLNSDFVDWSADPPRIEWEDWEFSARAKSLIWRREEDG